MAKTGLAGRATTRSDVRDWSVVLKILAERAGEDPAGHPYWKREAEAYRSDLLRDVPDGFVQADVYRVAEYPGKSVWLWLEDLTDEHGGEWPLAQYRRTATHLGQFDGTLLAGADVSSEPWVVERTFDFGRTAGAVALVDSVPDDPVVRHLFPTSVDRERLFAAWRDRDRFVATRRDLPETFCHTRSVQAAVRTLMREVGVPAIPAEDLERIAVPTALVWGRNDRAVRLGVAEDASASYGWPLHVIDDAADDPKLERPEACLAALHEVFDGRSGRRGTAGRR